MTGPAPARVTYRARVLIEQAIARGETLDWIIDNLHVPTTWVDQTLRILDAAHDGRHAPQRALRANLQPCGTPAAYRRHKRSGEPIDAACRDAARAYDRWLSRRKRGPAMDADEYDRLIAVGVSAHVAATLAKPLSGSVRKRSAAA